MEQPFVDARPQFLWTLLIMALVGNMIASYHGGSPAIVNFDMFVAVFSMLSLIYLFAATLEYVDVPIVTLVLDALNVIFFFIGGTATAAYLHVHSCNNKVRPGSPLLSHSWARPFKKSSPTSFNLKRHAANRMIQQAYLVSNHITAGSEKICREGQASTAFLWFGFAAYVATLVFSFMNRSGVNLRGPGIGRGRPAMSQV
jgi:hypothetical protein